MPSPKELQRRPELALGPNPLIEAAAPYVPFRDLPDKLVREPLANVHWKIITPASREALLELAPRHFGPCRWMLEIADGIQRLIRSPLVQRNPLVQSERVRTNRMGMAADWQAMKHVIVSEGLEGAGGRICGITGMGKSSLVKMCLEVFAPKQVITYDACPAAGWNQLVQCVYLYVDHPSNGTRGGLLERILLAFDNALGTNYSDYKARQSRNLDRFLVLVCKLMCLHRVALVVIDEKQEPNFQDSAWMLEFILFYLHLMNIGTSVLLVGNPMAFQKLQAFAQVERRFSAGGLHSIDPAATADDPAWRDDLVPFMRRFNLVEDCTVGENVIAQWEFENSAGIPGLLRSLRVEAQRSALRRGGMRAQLQPRDLKAAVASPSYKKLLRIATAVRSDDGEFVDIPTGHPGGRSRSQRHALANERGGRASFPTNPTAVDTVARILGRFKAEQTRQIGRVVHQMRSMAKMTDDDMRMLGLNEDLLKGLAQFNEQRSRTTAKRRRAKKSK